MQLGRPQLCLGSSYPASWEEVGFLACSQLPLALWSTVPPWVELRLFVPRLVPDCTAPLSASDLAWPHGSGPHHGSFWEASRGRLQGLSTSSLPPPPAAVGESSDVGQGFGVVEAPGLGVGPARLGKGRSSAVAYLRDVEHRACGVQGSQHRHCCSPSCSCHHHLAIPAVTSEIAAIWMACGCHH